MKRLAGRGAAFSVLDGATAVPVCASFGASGRVATSGASQSGCLPDPARHGLALIVVIGILGVLAVLAVAFVAMAQLERRASEQRVNAARAYLLARSGVEDALARLELGQDAAYGGEDWDASGNLNGFEVGAEVYQRETLNVQDCPARHAMRPSFFARSNVDLGADGKPAPRRIPVEDRERGYSGALSGDHAPKGNTYALKVSSSNAGIHINGGALDAEDRDPDGPGAPPEAAPLLPNKVPDHRDASMEGPNGFLVRLLNNLDAVVSNGATSNLGVQVVGARPVGGYKSLDELKPVLGQARYDRFKPYLTLHAWVDPKVVKPQPMDGRPQRWEDIDDAHRIGTEAGEISGVHFDPTVWTWGSGETAVSGILLCLDPGILRSGEGGPWTQTITATNQYEGQRSYPVTWERAFVYAWSQLRPAPLSVEPRAPISLAASREVLAAACLGLKGTWLKVWDGSSGWDGGFGWYGKIHVAIGIGVGVAGMPPQGTYVYPHRATEETPWHRTRLDYGMTYGTSARPWYAPESYKPHAPPPYQGASGKPLVQSAPLGRLRETEPIGRDQALAVADALLARAAAGDPPRIWAAFSAFVDALPSWEDADGDGALDGEAYTVTGSWLTPYTRRIYQREDLDSDRIEARERFPNDARGLTAPQKDLLKAMANPNTDLNDFNPDANLWKEVDKTDLAGIAAAASSYVHTTELALGDAGGRSRIHAVGRVLGGQGRLLASRQAGALAVLGRVHRDTAQQDFLRDALFEPRYAEPQPSPAPYPLSGGQALVSYPEPPGAAGAPWDGQVSLGFVGSEPGPGETLRGDLFGTPDAGAGDDAAAPDLRGPRLAPLLGRAGLGTGNVLADGVYSEKDRTLRFPLSGNIPKSTPFYLGFWVKPNWFPEATPRPHTLAGVSLGPKEWPVGPVPVHEILLSPACVTFVPARNNTWEDMMGVYLHDPASTRGLSWPRRCLLWGQIHTFTASDTLNRRGIEAPALGKPLGRLEGRRWQHVAALGKATVDSLGSLGIKLILGRALGSLNGGDWQTGGVSLSGTSDANYKKLHLRFGELAAAHNMNYAADATFANVRVGVGTAGYAEWERFFLESTGPAARGRYYKEGEAAYTSAKLPAGVRPLRITWTEIPCDLWFDKDGDGWLGDVATGHKPLNDQFGSGGAPDPNGKRDVRIDLEVWDDLGTADPSDDVKLARFDNPAADNRIPQPSGRLYYKAIFVNEWDAATRANHPLDVTPFLDDVTIEYADASGPRVLAWGSDED